MVPMTNQTTVSGKPLNKLIQKEKLQQEKDEKIRW